MIDSVTALDEGRVEQCTLHTEFNMTTFYCNDRG